jgi:hypothetical protein
MFLTPVQIEWKVIEKKKEYPVPQGNMPMIKFLKTEKQNSLISSYNNVCSICFSKDD